MDKLISDIAEGLARAYGEAAKVIGGKSNLPKPHFPEVGHLLDDRDMKSPTKFFEVRTIPEMKWKKQFSHFNLVGMESYHCEFPSPLETPFDVNNRVKATWVKQPGPHPRPVVLILHGLVMPDYAGMDQLPLWFKLHGLDGVILDLPYHMSRTPEKTTSGAMAIKAEADWLLAMVLQCIVDIRTLGLWFKQEGVASSLGYFGISMGAYLGLILSCCAKEIDFGISLVGVVDLVEGLMRFEDVKGDVEAWEKHNEAEHPMKKDKRVRALLNPLQMKLLQRPESLFMANGEFDHLVTPYEAQAFADKWHLPHFHLYPTGHISTLTVNPAMIRHLNSFLKMVGKGSF